MPTPSLTRIPSVHSTKSKKLLVLAPRKLFSSHERKPELKHFINLMAAWSKLAGQKNSSLDFLLLSAKHPLEKPSGVVGLKQNSFLSSLTGLDVDSGEAPAASGSVAVNFVESIGFDKAELASFLEAGERQYAIPGDGWHHWPTTRWLVSDSYALHSAGRSLLDNGKFAGVLAVGWPVFDSALHLGREFSIPSFFNYSTPSRLEAAVDSTSPNPAIVAREHAGLKHGTGILAFDVAQLGWLLKNYSSKQFSPEKQNDFSNAAGAVGLLSDSLGLRQLLVLRHAAAGDKRAAVRFLKQVHSTLAGHPVSHASSFISSSHCAAFNSAIELRPCSKQEISSARRKIGELASLEGSALGSKRREHVFSLVFTDASDAMLNNFSKAISLLPDSAFLFKADSPKLAARFAQFSSQAGEADRIAAMPGRGEVSFLAASQAIAFPNSVGALVHYEQGVSAVNSAKQAGFAPPALLATAAAPLLLQNSLPLSPADSPQEIAAVFRQSVSGGHSHDALDLEGLREWSWEKAAQKMVEFLSAKL